MYLGGYDSACELVKGGEIESKDFKFFARYCGWGPGQLESECARGVWYPVAGPLSAHSVPGALGSSFVQ